VAVSFEERDPASLHASTIVDQVDSDVDTLEILVTENGVRAGEREDRTDLDDVLGATGTAPD
jgi:hypothetical protein